MEVDLEPANQQEINLIDMMGEEANFKNFSYIDPQLVKQHTAPTPKHGPTQSWKRMGEFYELNSQIVSKANMQIKYYQVIFVITI